MIHLPSLSALRCFDASARLGSFTRAGAEVHLTQGAVSHQIIGLEQQLGVPLFIRKRHGLELTGPGRAYWTEVNSALRQLERATHHLITSKGDGGTLNLSVASTFGSFWLMERLHSFVSTNPQVTLNLSTRIGPADFSSGTTDAAIEYSDGDAEGFVARKIMTLELHPYVAARAVRANDRPRTRAAIASLLARLPLIRHTTVDEAWAGWLEAASLQDAVAREHLEAGPRYDLLSMALNGVIAGLGIALLPDYVVKDAVQRRQIVRLSDTAWISPKAYYLRYPAWKSGAAPLRRFEEWLARASTGELPGSYAPMDLRHASVRGKHAKPRG